MRNWEPYIWWWRKKSLVMRVVMNWIQNRKEIECRKQTFGQMASNCSGVQKVDDVLYSTVLSGMQISLTNDERLSSNQFPGSMLLGCEPSVQCMCPSEHSLGGMWKICRSEVYQHLLIFCNSGAMTMNFLCFILETRRSKGNAYDY